MNMADPVNPEIINTTVLPYPPLNNRGEVVYLTAVLEENSLFLGGPGFGESAELFQYNIAPMLSVEEPGGAEFVDSLDLSVLVNDVNLVYSMQIEDEIPVLVTGQIDENGRAVIPDDKLIVFNEQFADFLSVTELPFAGRIEIEDETIYLMNPTKGIRIYDSFDEPGLTGWYDTPGLAQQLMLIDSLIVIADTWSLQLLQVAEPDGIEPAKKHMAVDFELVSLYPNPFNSHVSINFRISHPNSVYFSIYNVMGQSVWTGFVPGVEKRSHSVTIDLSAQGSGLYFLQALSGNNMTTRRMTLLK